ncbi:hypothetical protein CP532_5635 [Ophiocordyceps camponoti-leonardi (nom. inval.)]|nr:hypothetical protein CP532_5635 [Ophiocordyceps camponoti-leonardi (nom. inval.)]
MSPRLILPPSINGVPNPRWIPPRGFEPLPGDIAFMRATLMRAKGLPPDIIDLIFDQAEYWAHSSSFFEQSVRISGTDAQENKFLIRCPPVGITKVSPLAEELAYDTTEAQPLPLQEEWPPASFADLVDHPTPRLIHPCRKIVFAIKSHDQGWGNTGITHDFDNYATSWTWFEAGLERFDASQVCTSPVPGLDESFANPCCPGDAQCTYDVRRESSTDTAPSLPVCGLRPIHPAIHADNNSRYSYSHSLLPDDRLNIQRNRAAFGQWQNHRVVWSWLDDIEPNSSAGEELHRNGRGRASANGSFVRSLKLGDVVTIWGKARFPQWVNMVESIRVDVYWAV